MRTTPPTFVADAWRLWRADWEVLTAIAGMFVLLPQLAMALLIPQFPDATKLTNPDPTDPAFVAWRTVMEAWVQNYALWYLLGVLIAVFGQFALVAFYLGGERLTVGQALGAASRSIWRYLMASLLWALPFSLVSLLFLLVPFLLMPLLAVAMARMLLIAPVILARRGPIAGAVAHSFVLTRGHTLALASLVLGVIIAQLLLAAPLIALDQWLAANSPNPIALAIADIGIAVVQSLASIAMALLQVAAYRRLSTR